MVTSEDPAAMEQAKKLAAGALGEKMAKYPLLFAKAVFFGEPPSKDHKSKINNATVTLLDLGEGPLAVTCAHVLSAYREVKKATGNALFQIGSVVLDPDVQLVRESTELDVAVLELTEAQTKEITSDGEIGSCVFKPASWPPSELKAGEFVAFGGFPGQWRECLASAELEFGSFSSGACRVATVSEERFSCQFEREYWVKSFGESKGFDLKNLGGLSGGPSFIKRKLHWELVGFIYEFSREFDIMFFRPAGIIQLNDSPKSPSL